MSAFQGTVTVDGESFVLEHKDFLYIGLGHEHVQFASSSGEQAKFYLVSATAHRAYPTQKVAIAELTPNHLGKHPPRTYGICIRSFMQTASKVASL